MTFTILATLNFAKIAAKRREMFGNVRDAGGERAPFCLLSQCGRKPKSIFCMNEYLMFVCLLTLLPCAPLGFIALAIRWRARSNRTKHAAEPYKPAQNQPLQINT